MMVITVSSLFATVSPFTNQIFGQSTDINGANYNEDDSITYPKFLACLSESEEIRGYATDTDIRDCHETFYNSNAESESSSKDSNRSNESSIIDLWPIT